jgi:hypothetical protein
MDRFKEILLVWAEENGNSFKNNRYPALLDLMKTYQNYGFKKDDFTTSKMLEIVEICTNPNHKNKSKLKGWREIVLREVERAWTSIFSDIIIATATLDDIKVKPVDKPDRPELQPPPEIEQKEPEQDIHTPKNPVNRELFKNEPKPNVEIDREAAEFLGVDLDE